MISLLPRRIRKSRIYPPPGIRDATLPEGRDFLMWVGFTPALPHKNKQLCLISAELNFFNDSRNHQAFTAPLVRPEMNLLTGFLLSGSDKE